MEPAEWPPVKTQSIRLYDVFVLGPLMLAGGLIAARRAPLIGSFVAINGLFTTVFNGVNYLKIREREKIAVELQNTR